ncbi:MAG: hypothetical protein JRN15_06040 [Nitrososphaerota archaeon]|nr:hypothetical protein [Nitrososphaerota archaeon]
MIQFDYSPIKRIVVHELNEFQNDEFFEDIVRMSLEANTRVEPSVNWVDGIAFMILPMPEVPEVVVEKLNGIVHYSSVSFTRLEYRPRYPLRISNQEYHTILRRSDRNPVFAGLVRWIKSNPSHTRASSEAVA